MARPRRNVFLFILMLAGLAALTQGSATAQAPADVLLSELKAQEEGLKAAAGMLERLPPRQRALLSSAARNLIARARSWPRLVADLERRAGAADARGAAAEPPAHRTGALRLGFEPTVDALTIAQALSAPLTGGRINNPAADGFFTSRTGFTQNNSATAWCSPSVVVVYDDSGSAMESLIGTVLGTNDALSLGGYSRSTNNGTTYTDAGFIDGSPFTVTGSPSVACADANTFYIAAMMTDTSVSPNLSFIGVMKSVNGGASWSAPVAATAAFDVTTSHWDKPWIAVDPANPNFVYVGATFVNTTLCGPGDTFTGIGAARSINSGATFLPHVVIDSACDTGNGDRVGGSQIAVGPTGDVLVSWLEFEDSLPGAHAQLLLRRSVNNGAVYAAAETVSDVFPAGGAFFHPILDTIGLLRGGAFQPSFPTMAVDRSGGAGNGAVYVAWNDGRLVSTGSGSTAYRFGDIFLARREPGGGWGPPVRVNNSAEPQTTGAYAGQGFDQFRPAVAVDRTGTVAVCYYDRRGDKSNFLMTRWCAKSTNGGATWQNKAKSTGGLPLLSGVDDTFGDVTDQGIYDSLVSDTRNLLTGFRGAWTDHTLGNQDLKQNIP